MFRVAVVLTFWLAAAVIVALTIFDFLFSALVAQETPVSGEELVPELIQYANTLDLIQTVLAIMAGLGAVFLGVYAYRRQSLQEIASNRDDYDQFLARYNSATEQLGHDKAAARLAGVYAMTRLANDWPDQRQQCVDVLCAYLRTPIEDNRGDFEVRSTILRIIEDHVRPVRPTLSDLGSPKTVEEFRRSHPLWTELSFNLDGAELHDASFEGARFSGDKVSFRGAKFIGETNFESAVFSTSTPTDFQNATFEGRYVNFAHAFFNSWVTSFVDATFNTKVTSFRKTGFHSRHTSFVDATFTGDSLNFFQCNVKRDNNRENFVDMHFGKTTFDVDAVKFDRIVLECAALNFHKITLKNCAMTFDGVTPHFFSHIIGLDTTILEGDSTITRDEEPFPPRK